MPGFPTIYAKYSDIFGRKSFALLALFIFGLFSILCGVSNLTVASYHIFPPSPIKQLYDQFAEPSSELSEASVALEFTHW
jgi:MFS family permease